MGNTDITAREADSISLDKQSQSIDFIELFKDKQSRKNNTLLYMPPEEIETFFRSFSVDTSDYKFDREDANVR